MLARDRRSERAYVPLTIDERDRFIDAASRAKMPLAVWLRWLAEAETRRTR